MTDVAALIAAIAALLAAVPPFIELYQKSAAARRVRRDAAGAPERELPKQRRRLGADLARDSGAFSAVLVVAALLLFLVPRVSGSAPPTTPPPSPTPSTVSPTPSAPASSGAATAASAACRHGGEVSVTSPRRYAAFGGAEGVRLSGTACGLNGRSVWFYDLDHADGFYYPDADGPVITADGAWSYTDAPIGDSGDNHKTYTITLIWADQSCNKILLNLPEIDGDQKFTKVPRGCSIAATVDVSITNP